MPRARLPKDIALITGINGQDGLYLARLLLSKGYEVHGLTRGDVDLSAINFKKFLPEHLFDSQRLFFHRGNITDSSVVNDLVSSIQPSELYNFAAQSNVEASCECPTETFQANAFGTVNVLEAVRQHSPKTRVLQAVSSELFSGGTESPQNERTLIKPTNPYGVSKALSYWATKCYRESFGVFACSSISFNHESPIRPQNFITRKVVLSLCRIKLGSQAEVSVGNLYAKKDWGHADDIVRGQWLMLKRPVPDDFVLGTGVSRTVKELISEVALLLNMTLSWSGSGIREVGIWENGNGKPIVKIAKKFLRQESGADLVACPKKAREELLWVPKVSFGELLQEMIESENKKLKGTVK
ncbi:GDP-mannose 4,6-dehydratase [Alphaproteobacteria bacterium]|nr:GDP-mannose 4,6-dehydratase [Alphaproteobacteria bacterium]